MMSTSPPRSSTTTFVDSSRCTRSWTERTSITRAPWRGGQSFSTPTTSSRTTTSCSKRALCCRLDWGPSPSRTSTAKSCRRLPCIGSIERFTSRLRMRLLRADGARSVLSIKRASSSCADSESSGRSRLVRTSATKASRSSARAAVYSSATQAAIWARVRRQPVVWKRRHERSMSAMKAAGVTIAMSSWEPRSSRCLSPLTM